MVTINVLGVPHTYHLTAPTQCPHALVFIHGWLLSRGYWQPLIERLAPQYQCLSYDLRGFGYSQPPGKGPWRTPLAQSAVPEAGSDLSSMTIEGALGVTATLTRSQTQALEHYTPSAYAQDLKALLEQLNISSAWLIGHSLGGTIALWGAEALSDRVKGVICLNAGGGIYLKEEFERFRAAGQQLIKLRPRWLCHLPLIDLLFTRANVVNPVARCWGRQRILDFVMADAEAALGTLLDSTTEAEVHQLPQLVARLPQPAYFMAGDRDPIMPPKYVRHLASFHHLFADDGNNVLEIPTCGHMGMLEQPDWVTQQIQVILSRHA